MSWSGYPCQCVCFFFRFVLVFVANYLLISHLFSWIGKKNKEKKKRNEQCTKGNGAINSTFCRIFFSVLKWPWVLKIFLISEMRKRFTWNVNSPQHVDIWKGAAYRATIREAVNEMGPTFAQNRTISVLGFAIKHFAMFHSYKAEYHP